MKLREFDDASYTALRKNLLQSKGSGQQKELLNTLRSSDDFSQWIRSEVDVLPGEELPHLEDPMTESEFKDPPKSTEELVYETWKSITPASACRVAMWGYVTLRHIETSRIKPSYLAANGVAGSNGLERIDQVLNQGDSRQIDGVVRSALRNLSGLPEARGNRSVYVNCPLARAWWRRHIADEVCESTGADMSEVLKVLGYSQQYWEELVSIVVSRNSILGDTKVRTSLIWVLSGFVNDSNSKHLFQSKSVKTIRRLLGIRSAWQEMAVFDKVELKQIMTNSIIPFT